MKIKEAEALMDAGKVVKNITTTRLYKKENGELVFLFHGKWKKSVFGISSIEKDNFEEYKE